MSVSGGHSMDVDELPSLGPAATGVRSSASRPAKRECTSVSYCSSRPVSARTSCHPIPAAADCFDLDAPEADMGRYVHIYGVGFTLGVHEAVSALGGGRGAVGSVRRRRTVGGRVTNDGHQPRHGYNHDQQELSATTPPPPQTTSFHELYRYTQHAPRGALDEEPSCLHGATASKSRLLSPGINAPIRRRPQSQPLHIDRLVRKMVELNKHITERGPYAEACQHRLQQLSAELQSRMDQATSAAQGPVTMQRSVSTPACRRPRNVSFSCYLARTEYKPDDLYKRYSCAWNDYQIPAYKGPHSKSAKDDELGPSAPAPLHISFSAPCSLTSPSPLPPLTAVHSDEGIPVASAAGHALSPPSNTDVCHTSTAGGICHNAPEECVCGRSSPVDLTNSLGALNIAVAAGDLLNAWKRDLAHHPASAVLPLPKAYLFDDMDQENERKRRDGDEDQGRLPSGPTTEVRVSKPRRSPSPPTSSASGAVSAQHVPSNLCDSEVKPYVQPVNNAQYRADPGSFTDPLSADVTPHDCPSSPASLSSATAATAMACAKHRPPHDIEWSGLPEADVSVVMGKPLSLDELRQLRRRQHSWFRPSASNRTVVKWLRARVSDCTAGSAASPDIDDEEQDEYASQCSMLTGQMLIREEWVTCVFRSIALDNPAITAYTKQVEASTIAQCLANDYRERFQPPWLPPIFVYSTWVATNADSTAGYLVERALPDGIHGFVDYTCENGEWMAKDFEPALAHFSCWTYVATGGYVMVTGLKGVRVANGGYLLLRPTIMSETPRFGTTAVGAAHLKKCYKDTLARLGRQR